MKKFALALAIGIVFMGTMVFAAGNAVEKFSQNVDTSKGFVGCANNVNK